MAKTYLEIKKTDKMEDIRKKFKKLYPNLSLVFTRKFGSIPSEKDDIYPMDYKVGDWFKKVKDGKVDVSPERSIIDALDSFKNDIGVFVAICHPVISYDQNYYPLGMIVNYWVDMKSQTFKKFNEKIKNKYDFYKLTY